MSLIPQIISNADRLSVFVSGNMSYLPIASVRQMENQSAIPSRFSFINQIVQLSEQIEQFVSANMQRARSLSIAFTSTNQSLRNTLTDPSFSSSLGDLEPELRRISQLARSCLPVEQPVYASSSPAASGFENDYASVEDADVSIGESEESLPDYVVDENVQDHVTDDLRRKDERIFHTRSHDVQVVDSMIAGLHSYPDPWPAAFASRDWILFDSFPGLLEGRLIQLSPSYQAYLAATRTTNITETEYNAIRNMSFQTLAAEMGKAFDLSQEISPLMIKLKLQGKALAGQNERLVYLGISRQEEIVRQRGTIAQINGMSQVGLAQELTKAMRSESIIFIEPVIQGALESIPRDVLNELVVWLAARGHTHLLTRILDQRMAEVSPQKYYDAMDFADYWGHNACYQALFTHYPHNKSGAAKALLINLAERGVEKGVSHLLSVDYPHGFVPQTIDQAFNAAYDKQQLNCLKIFFDSGVIPYDNTLNTIFANLCQNKHFGQLEWFFRPDIILRIPNANTILNQTVEELCAENDLSNLEFFLKPEIGARIDDNRIMDLAECLIFNDDIKWEELNSLLQLFFASPLYDRLSTNMIYTIANDAGASGKHLMVHALLNSRRGDEIGESSFDQILLNIGESSQWNTLLEIIDYPRYQPLSGYVLGLLLSYAVQKGPLEVVSKLFSKEQSDEPITHSVLCQNFKIVAGNGDLQWMQVFLNHNPPPQLSDPELAQILLTHYQQRKFDAAEFLVRRMPNISRMPPDVVTQIILASARTGKTNMLMIPYQNIGQVPLETFEAALFSALSHRQKNSAIQIYEMIANRQAKEFATVDSNMLLQCATHAGQSGDRETLEFLFTGFKHQMNRQICEAAYNAAEANGQITASAYLWEYIWNKSIHASQ